MSHDIAEKLHTKSFVWRVGEIFGEFGIGLVDEEAADSSNPFEIEKWQLRIVTESRESVYDEELSFKSHSKVVKLKPSTAFLVQVRCFSVKAGDWGPWSEFVRTRTFAPVVTSVSEIGEDYCRFQWDRPTRDTTLTAEERLPDAMSVVSEISRFQLRVVREVDMLQEFCDEFETGVRTYTLHELRPGTAYIVFVRYSTLIGTLKVWTEVCRFYTQASHELSVSQRGEDRFTVEWARPALPPSIGYLLPVSSIHKFEVSIDGVGDAIESTTLDPIELASSVKTHEFQSLLPGCTYRIRLRCLTKEGRWGSKTKPLVVRLADTPLLRAEYIGETLCTVGWSRSVEEEEEEVTYEIRSTSSGFNDTKTIKVDKERRNVSMRGLVANHTYEVRIRNFLHGVWGQWSEYLRVTTNAPCSLQLVERGEDFLTVVWHSVSGSQLTNLSVVNTAQEKTVLDEEVENPSGNGFRINNLEPNTRYEIKARAWQRNPFDEYEGWGEYSIPTVVATLQSVDLQIVDVGENMAQLTWRRALSLSSEATSWVDLKYEVVLGCIDSGEDTVVHKEVLDTTYTIDNLKPATSYVVSVRACDEKEQWGKWSKTRFHTLAPVRAGIHEIGEDFVRVVWNRETDPNSEGAPDYVSEYKLFIYSDDDVPAEPHSESGYSTGGNAELQAVHSIERFHTSFKASGLFPDRNYVVVVRAATATGKWGLWSNTLRFRTVSPFRVPAQSLSIGENYVHLVWDRDENPQVGSDVVLGDFSVVAQQLRIVGVDSDYKKDHSLVADQREKKIYGLSPATAYSIQIRACNKSGEWGLWSAPVYIMTRATIVCRPVEVAEDYLIVSWEKLKAFNPNSYPTGKGFITSYQLRVSNSNGVHLETPLSDGDSPYCCSGLEPDTFYCVELKANYNGEEWGLWSTPLWCLTMKHMDIRTDLISEEFCNIRIMRLLQPKRLPEDEGNAATEDRIISFGQLRPLSLLRVTTPAKHLLPHATARSDEAPEERLVYQVELSGESEDILHTIPNLKSDTIYNITVRSKLKGGEWGMWSPTHTFMTVPPIAVNFTNIAENSLTIDWKRKKQHVPARVPKISSGLGLITKSRLKIRDQTGSYQQTLEIDSQSTSMTVDKLLPATTYQVTVQTFNDNHDWGVWSDEARARTVSSMVIDVENISEDAVWLSWMRRWDPQTDLTHNTALNVDTVVKAYEMKIVGEGQFCYNRELDGQNCFFRGLQPDSVYEVRVRAQSKSGVWGIWATKTFRTLPTLRVSFGNIGEHFAVVEWRRHLPTMKNSADEVIEASDIVQEFRLKVEREGQEPHIYELSPTISSFRLTNLDPSTEYRVWMCAKGHEGVWGLWNEECRVRTLPQLDLRINDIGEDYVTVEWNRSKWIGERAPKDPGVKVYEIDGAVSGYHVKVLNEEGNVINEAHVGYMQTKHTLQHLDLRTVYTVMVCAKDTYNEWGLWSQPHRFATLQPVQMNLLRIGENFIRLEWERRTRLRKFVIQDTMLDQEDDEAEEFQEEDEEMAEGVEEFSDEMNEEEGDVLEASDEAFSEEVFDVDVLRGNEDVIEWHVRVYGSRLFGGQPGADDYKEFFPQPDCTDFDIVDLIPSTTYTVAVRAKNMCNEWGRWSQAQSFETMPLVQLDVEYIAENFVQLAWERPSALSPLSFIHSFPPSTALHNYQVQIRPLASETQFDEEEEPLVDGARIYETSQPSLRLQNLLPGTRYKITVREQMLNNERDGLDLFGIPSEQKVVETIEPMMVNIVELGENFADLGWRRMRRDDEDATAADSAHSITRSSAKTQMYEVKLIRLDDQAENAVKGPLALSVSRQFEVGTLSYLYDSLFPNTIYSVCIRAQTEGDHWGGWSLPMKFVTQKLLVVRAELVNEDNFFISWTRLPPDWHRDSTPTPVFRGDDLSSATVDDMESHAGDDPLESTGVESDGGLASPRALDEVQVAEYAVQLYEISVEGIGNDFKQTLELSAKSSSTRVSNLQHNCLYTVSVRSKSLTQKWSLSTRNISVCTPNPMCAMAPSFTENMIRVGWERPSQSILEHEKILKKLQIDVQREIESQEKRARLERQQELEERAATGSGTDDMNMEIHTRNLEEEIAHLKPENIHMGKSESAGYQLQLFGDSGFPNIDGTAHLLTIKKSRKKKGVTFRGSTSSRQQKKRSTFIETKDLPRDDEDELPIAGDEQRLLLDVKINSKTDAVSIMGLVDSSDYEFCIRSRNIYGEWGPWSQRVSVKTLTCVSLAHARFGEHYINLYWHRISEDVLAEQALQQKREAEFEEAYREVTTSDLERMKVELPTAEYEDYIAQLKEWKSLQRAVGKWKTNLIEGGGEVIHAAGAPVVGYHLRIVQENGNVTDRYFEEAGQGSHKFTVTGLQPNNMYAVMLCPDYGDSVWGSWSAPIKFMTQNLIQLSMSYVGESFVDIEWKRAPNKRVHDSSVLVNPTAQGWGHQYQVSIQHTRDDGERVDERRSVSNCSVFRIDKLQDDCLFEICVREWDPKGEWGMWSAPKSCATLAGMRSTVAEIGEDWLHVSWLRKVSNLKINMSDPNLVQLPVENEGYFLRVEELRDNGLGDPVEDPPEEQSLQTEQSGTEEPTDDLADLLSSMKNQSSLSTLPVSEPPTECEGVVDGRYLFVKRFSYDVTEFRLDKLDPDRFYNVQVLCETTGKQLGSWSPDQFILTLAKIKLRAALIHEQSVRVTWNREPPRVHPRLDPSVRVITGSYKTHQFELQANGLQKGNAYSYTESFQKNMSECKLDNLQLDSSYSLKIRSVDDHSRKSLWSDDLEFITLKPLRVLPMKVTENSLQYEWGRDAQLPEDYPECTAQPVIAMEKANQYHVRVFSYNDSELPLLDKQFAGTTTRFQLSMLSPNTAYVIQARSCNVIGEWGLWSDDRVIYTMKLLTSSVMAVGEDYIMLSWSRDAPDELQEVEQIEDTDDRRDDNIEGLQIRKKFPLLDIPPEPKQVFATQRTKIVRYGLSVTRHEESEGWTTEVPNLNDCSFFTIPGLRHDSRYTIAVRACYSDDEWGPWSDPVESGTLNLLVVDVKNVGEDYLSMSWQRSLNTYVVNEVQMGKPEETLGYQFMVHDFTDVPIGEEASVPLSELCVRDSMIANKFLTAKQLKSNRRYRLSVRRWYRPVTVSDSRATVVDQDDKPMTEEQRLQELITQSQGVAGGWSEPVFVLTLREMVVMADDIGEDFMHIKWERDPNAPSLPTRQCVRVTAVVQSYLLRIHQLTQDGQTVDNGPGTFHQELSLGPDEVSLDLKEFIEPDHVYQIDVRCMADKVWGLWSRAVVVVTLPKLTVSISSIGEDYVHLSWERKVRTLELADGRKTVTGNTNLVDKYQLEMYGIDHPFHLEKKFKASRTSYRVKRLEAQTLYSIAIRSCDGTNIWSLWSDTQVFATLKPVQLSFGKIGEQFAYVSWNREDQTVEEYAAMSSGNSVQLGSTEVISYHLCVFSMDHSPSAAIIDKQLSGETNSFRVSGLNPNTSYIVIIRACNTESQWGLWSEEKVVSTLKLIQVNVVSIGESYLTVKWARDEGDMAPVDTISPLGIRIEPTAYHICITSETENIDKNFTMDDCQIEDENPTFTIRQLSPDTRYIVALQACYGSEEWGMWTKPLTFATLNTISITVNNITEEKADFTWGRAQQAPSHAYDPNIIVWRSTILKYQLLIRKLEQVKAAEKLEMQREASKAVPDVDTEEAKPAAAVAAIPDQEPAPGTEGAPDAQPTASDEIRIEREMEVKQAKYVQTFCSVDQLQVNTEYHVQVRALDERQEWGDWSQLTFDTPPSAPVNPTLKKSGAQYVFFSWDAPDPFTRYSYCVEQAIVKETQVKKATARGGSASDSLDWRVVDTVEEPSCRLRALGPLGKVRCRVKCCKVDKASHLFSKYSQITSLVSAAPPEPVNNLMLTSLSKTTGTLEWSRAAAPTDGADMLQPAPPGRTNYRVMLAQREQQPSLLATTRNTSYEVTDLKPSTPYRVQIQVETDNGVSSRNIVLKFTTKAESDKTVSRAAPGQPPLGQIVSRPGTQESDAVKLPNIAQPKASSSSRSNRVDIQQKSIQHTPRPPALGNSRKTAPHPPHKRGNLDKEKARNQARLRRHQPVASRSGRPAGDEPTTVEEFDVVAFEASDDEKE